jgi:hypothetical protein
MTTSFETIFSITWKVLAALFVISLIITVIAFMIGGLGQIGNSSRSDTSNIKIEDADTAHTKMPASKWNAAVKQCITKHGVMEGMTKEEVQQAVGGKEPWAYSIVSLKGSSQPCIKYDGENCVQYPPDEVKNFFLHFTPEGRLIWDEDSIGLNVYSSSELAYSLKTKKDCEKMGFKWEPQLAGNEVYYRCSIE